MLLSARMPFYTTILFILGSSFLEGNIRARADSGTSIAVNQ
jgi:hypothetical protein